MNTSAIQAARRYLTEVRGLGESQRVTRQAERRLQAAIESAKQSEAGTADAASLESLGLSERIVEALRGNAASRKESRLLDPAGLRAWIKEGNDLVDLTEIGRKSAQEIKDALGVE